MAELSIQGTRERPGLLTHTQTGSDSVRLEASAPRTASPDESALRRWQLTAAAFATVAGLWLLVHPYTGIRLDARIYMGRAVADLLPASVGRDMMFAEDGQSSFSVFTLIARLLVARLGPQLASAVISFAATCAWVSAMTVFAHRVAKGRLAWAMVICAAVLPAEYGGFAIIPYGEALALPRPFAEACVLASLSALLDRRRLAALVFLAVAALFHPIMALGGFGVFFMMMAQEDRRWLLTAGVGAILILIAAAIGVPVASRLFQSVDPAWLDLLHRRNPYLFPALWPASSWSRAAVQMTTTIIAASLLKGRSRALFAAAAAMAGLGVAVAWLVGDVFPSLLVLQMQPWRALWLIAVLGAAGLAVCAAKLWRRGPGAQVILAFLLVDWLALDSPGALVGALAALGLQTFARQRGGLPVNARIACAALGLAGLLAAAILVRMIMVAATLAATWPPHVPYFDVAATALHLPMMLAVPFALWLAASQSPLARAKRFLAFPLGAAILAFGILRWDRMPLYMAPGPGGDATLIRMLAQRPGAVEWVDGDIQSWMIAGRANWASEIQGATIVFTRHEAMLWQARMRQMMALGLTSNNILTPWSDQTEIIESTPAAVAQLCASPNGPAWVIRHMMADEPLALGPGTRMWAPAQTYYLREGLGWRRVRGFAVTRCDQAGGRSSPI